MLNSLNAERKANHLPPLRLNGDLNRSAASHTSAMVRTNTMSHQLPRELGLAGRISRTGYDWQAAGENVGWSGDMSANGIRNLESLMYNEKPPGETGHRVNILSRQYKDIGISVVIDSAHHKIWFTQDFGELMPHQR